MPLGAVVLAWLINVVTAVMQWLWQHPVIIGFLLLAWWINGLYGKIAELKETLDEVKKSVEDNTFDKEP